MSSTSSISALVAIRPEIWVALDRLLAAGAVDPAPDTKALGKLAADFHEVAEASRIADSEVAAIFADAVAGALTAMQLQPGDEQDRALLCEAWNAFSVYLRVVPAGVAATTALYSAYAALRLRADPAAMPAPADLFYPAASGVAVATTTPLPRLRMLRAEYEQGLLEWLRGKNTGLDRMYEALVGLPAEGADARFWRDVCGLIVALQKGVIEPGREIKMLFGQLSRAIRAVGESEGALPVDLHRLVLLEIAQASTSTEPALQEVVEYHQLQKLNDITPRAAGDLVHAMPRRLGIAMLNWKALRQHGKVADATAAVNAAEALRDYWLEQNNAAYADLWAGVAALLAPTATTAHEFMTETDVDITCAFYSTAALLCERVTLTEDETRALAERLKLAAQGENAAPDAILQAWSDHVSSRETLLRYQRLLQEVMREIRNDLQYLEQQVSDYLRAPSNTADAGAYRKRLEQVAGAFEVLQMTGVAELTRKCIEFLERMLRASPLTVADVTPIAEALCALQFYIERVLNEDPNAAGVVEPLLLRYGIGGTARSADAPALTLLQSAVPLEMYDKVIPQEELAEDSTAIPLATAAVESVVTPALVMEAPMLAAVETPAPTPASAEAVEAALSLSLSDFQLETAPVIVETPAAVAPIVEPTETPAFAPAQEAPKADFSLSDIALSFDNVASTDLTAAPSVPEPVKEDALQPASSFAELSMSLSGLIAELETPAEAPKAAPETPIVITPAIAETPASVAEAPVVETPAFVAPPQQAALSPEPAPVAAAPEEVVLKLSDDDAEIVEIFIEEAREILTSMADLLAKGRDGSFDEEALRDLRRAFHTLKGGSRLANLKDMGEAAAKFEKMMDKVLANNDQAGVHERVSYGHREFSAWIARLSLGFMPVVNLDAVEAKIEGKAAPSASAIASTSQQVSAAPPSVPAPIVTPAMPADESLNLRIEAGAKNSIAALARAAANAIDMVKAAGGKIEGSDKELPTHIPAAAPAPKMDSTRSVSVEIGRIFQNEAAQYMKILQDGLPNIMTGGKPNHEMSRAAHTLAGISRAMQITAIADISVQLEHWFDQRMFTEETPAPEALALIERGVQTLQTMMDQVGRKEEMPDPQPELASAINGLLVARQTLATNTIQQQSTGSVVEPVDDADAELARVFQREAVEMESDVADAFERWKQAPNDTEPIQFIARALHTLKGGARAVGAMQLGDIVHEIEERLLRWLPGNEIADIKEISGIQGDLDVWYEHLSGIASHKRAHDAPVSVFDTSRVTTPPPELAHLSPELMNKPPTDTTNVLAAIAALKDRIEKKVSDEKSAFDRTTTLSSIPLPELPENAGEMTATLSRAGDMTAALSSTGPLPITNPTDAATASSRTDSLSNTSQLSNTGQMSNTGPVAGVKERRAEDVKGTKQEATLRVSTTALDHMLRSVNEAAIARSATENDVRLLRESLHYLDESVTRLRNQVREIEVEGEKQVQARMAEMKSNNDGFDPLEFDRYTRLQELTRLVAESLHDIVSVQTNNLRFIQEADDNLEREARLNAELRKELTRVRAVSFSTVTPRLQRIVRQTARTLGKDANLVVHGEQTEFDKTVLERLVPPLEHMLRNSLAHGIEPPEDRRAVGKPAAGEIAIMIQQDVDRFTLTVKDDGRGLNFNRIRARGIAIGAIPEGAMPNSEELAQLIFLPGFSTSSEVTEVSGRGIGMDVVRAAIQALGGDVAVESVAGQSTTFRLHVPLTTLIVSSLLVRAAGSVYAIPSNIITLVRSCSKGEWAGISAVKQDTWLDRIYPLARLSILLGDVTASEPETNVKLLLLDDGERRCALQVDEILGHQELAVKDTGPQLLHAPGIKGASILGDDQIVFIMNPITLAVEQRTAQAATVAETDEPEQQTVMVVDDSITVRRITSRFLSRAGYQVVLAKDGMEAVDMLEVQGIRPDAMLLDVEMPRMDGFEVVRLVRGMPTLEHLPILMVTSRTAEKHREHAMRLGATRYIGKPYEEAALLEEIKKCIVEARRAAAAAMV